MKSETLYKAMNSIDDEVIYRNGKVNKVGNTRIRSRKPLYRILAACAAVAVIFSGVNVLRPLEKLGHNTGLGESNIEVANNNTVTDSPIQATRNMFVITANAAEPVNDIQNGTISSGDVMGLSSVSAGYGSALYLDQRLAISGENIEKVRISTDKCNIYSVTPVYEGDPDFIKAQNNDVSVNEEYVMIADVDDDFDEETSTEVTPYHFDHIVIEGNSYEGAYNNNMAFGMSVPEELWSKSNDDAQYHYENVDQVNGATITIAVTYTDGSVEEHHYCLNTGKIFVPVKDGYNDWNNLTRFLTAEEESAGEGYTYGYLMTKID